MPENIKQLPITIEREMLLDINAALSAHEGTTLEQLTQTAPERVYLAMRAAQLLVADHVDRTQVGDQTIDGAGTTARQSVEASMPYPVTEPTEVTISVWKSPRTRGHVRLENEREIHEIFSFIVTPVD